MKYLRRRHQLLEECQILGVPAEYHELGVELDAKDKFLARKDNSFYERVRSSCCYSQSIAHILYTLMMVRIDVVCAGTSHDVGEQIVAIDDDVVVIDPDSPASSVLDVGRQLSGKILIQGSPADHIQHLAATADAERRLVFGNGLLQH